MALESQDTVTIEPHEVEGLAEILELELDAPVHLLSAAADRRAHLANLAELVDAADALEQTEPGEAVTLPRSLALLEVIREGSDNAPERFGDALKGCYEDQEATLRQTRGLMSLGKRLGVYEGVVV